MMTKTLKILYTAGPGDVIETYNHWLKGEDDPSQVSVTYSSQFYDLCDQLDAKAYVISWNNDKKRISDGQFTIEHLPRLYSKASGIKYHLGYLLYGFKIILLALNFQADIVVLSTDTSYFFVFSILSWFGIKVIPSLHCVLWRKVIPPTRVQNTILKLDCYFFSHFCTDIIAVSDEIKAQVMELTNNKNNHVKVFSPLFRREQFAKVKSPNSENKRFKVLFAGRIEANKGVFILLDIAKRFAREGICDIVFDLCGSGSALDSLKYVAKEAQLESFFICHGHCNKLQMAKMYSQSHVVIVPTTTDFLEGFNKVVVEGILSTRPVITSAICPSMSSLREGILEVEPDNTVAYGDAILELYRNDDLYYHKQKACHQLQEKFYDSSNSWKAKLKDIILETNIETL